MLKKNLLATGISLAMALTLSCSDNNLSDSNSAAAENIFTEQEAKIFRIVQSANNRIDMEEAMMQVQGAIAFLDREQPSELGPRRVESVSVLFFGDTKHSVLESGEYSDIGISDTLAYIFNFNDSLGYVIVSYDVRVDSPLFAFTKKGRLVNRETNNPGLAIFLERLEGHVLESIIETEREKETMLDVVLGKFALESESDKQKLRVLARGSIPPLTSMIERFVPVEWGQEWPFWLNLNAPQCPSGYYVTGCVATAVAQIMAYWKHPGTPANFFAVWQFLNKSKKKQDFEPSPTDTPKELAIKNAMASNVASLFQQIGAGVNMSYGCDESETFTATALSFLISRGFTTNGLIDYNPNILVYLAWGPVITSGCDISNKVCHAWVIDGVSADATKPKPTSLYMHSNWGWDGWDNGYFKSGVFDPDAYNFQNIQFAGLRVL